MPNATVRYLDVTLSWECASAGHTALLRRRTDAPGGDELTRTTETSYVVRSVHPERTHDFAAAGVLEDGGLEPEDDWERVRVAPVASTGAPALPSAHTPFAAAQSGDQITLRWTPADDGLAATYEIRVGDSWEDPFGSFVGVPCFAKTYPEGTYETDPIDAGKIVHERVELDWATAQPMPVAPPFGGVRRPALGKRGPRDGGLLPPGTRSWSSRQSWRLPARSRR